MRKLTINRLNKFAQLELSADVRNFVKMGGEITTEAMSVITGTNVPHEQVVQDGPVVEPSFSKLVKGEHVFTVRFAHSVLIAELAKSHRKPRWKRTTAGGSRRYSSNLR